MKKFFSAIVFVLIFSFGKSQCTVTVPADAIVLNQDTTINLMFPGGPNFPYLVCHDVHVFITGLSTWFFDLYQMPGSYVEIDDTMNFFYVNCNIYLQNNATFDFNHKIGSDIDSMFHEPASLLVDTVPGATVWVPCNSLVFDFSLWPGGVSPCGVLALEPSAAPSRVSIFPNPAQNYFTVSCKENFEDAEYILSDLSGKVLLRGWLHQHNEKISIADLSTGVYLFRLNGNFPFQSQIIKY